MGVAHEVAKLLKSMRTDRHLRRGGRGKSSSSSGSGGGKGSRNIPKLRKRWKHRPMNIWNKYRRDTAETLGVINPSQYYAYTHPSKLLQ